MEEVDRLAAIAELDILDTAPEKGFDDLVRLASAICGAPMSLVSIVDAHRQWFKAAFGTELKETDRGISFCAHAIQTPDLFIVEDATQDERFRENIFVTEKNGVRFYAGIPLHAPNGAAVGTLCVIDTVPRKLSEHQREALVILGAQVEARLELRLKQKLIAQSLRENQQLYAHLKETTHLFEQFMHHGPFAAYIKQADGKFAFYNQFLAQIYGVAKDTWLGRTDHQLWPAEIADEFRRNDLQVLEQGVPVESDEITPNPDGTSRFWKSFKFPYASADGKMMVAGISVDVTREVAREAQLENALRDKSALAEKLEASQRLLHRFMEHNPNSTFVKDELGRYIFYNRCFAEFVGINETEWLGKSDDQLFPEEIACRYLEQDRLARESDQPLEFYDEAADAQGMSHRFRCIKFAYIDADGRSMLGGFTVDVTEQLKREEALADANLQLARLATTDPLTGLSNRRIFESRAAIEFARATRNKSPLSMLILDIDNFKLRNDRFGHHSGDEALKLLGGVLKNCVRIGDIAARIGGEEFGFLLPDTGAAGAMDLAERIRHLLSLESHGPLPLTLSLGIASLTPHNFAHSWEHLLRRADDALYEAKRSGKDRAIHCDNLALDGVPLAALRPIRHQSLPN